MSDVEDSRVVVRANEIKLYERLNETLIKENERLALLLEESIARYDELKLQFDKRLGLVPSGEEDKPIELSVFKPVGGFKSSRSRALELSLASKRNLDTDSEN